MAQTKAFQPPEPLRKSMVLAAGLLNEAASGGNHYKLVQHMETVLEDLWKQAQLAARSAVDTGKPCSIGRQGQSHHCRAPRASHR